MIAPTRIHGYEVLASFATPKDSCTRPGHVVLVDRSADYAHQPFVTAWIGEGDSSWCWGHYFTLRADADADFAERCLRGY